MSRPAAVTRVEIPRHDLAGVRANNPGPFTVTGTNSWVVGRDPAWVVDPGPMIEEHVEALYEAIDDRGGLGGAVLTHDHQDHSEAARALVSRYGAPLAGARGAVDIALAEDAR